MFYGQSPFYFATARKISVAFGSLFNNIYIQRFDDVGGQGNVIRTVRVPLSYSAGEKWYMHRKQDVPAQEQIQTKISLPRIGYELTGFQYDAQRQLNKLNGLTTVGTSDVTQFLRQLNPVPYDFSFDVNIAVKNMDDGLQIVEQILPTFDPSFNLNVQDIPELQIVRDVPVIFGGVTKTDTYEGGFGETRVLEWTLTFVVKGWFYPPIKDAEVIKRVLVDVYKDKELAEKYETLTARVDPLTAMPEDDYDIVVDVFNEDELDTNGMPITDSNGAPI